MQQSRSQETEEEKAKVIAAAPSRKEAAWQPDFEPAKKKEERGFPSSWSLKLDHHSGARENVASLTIKGRQHTSVACCQPLRVFRPPSGIVEEG